MDWLGIILLAVFLTPIVWTLWEEHQDYKEYGPYNKRNHKWDPHNTIYNFPGEEE